MYYDLILIAIILNDNDEILLVKRNRKPGIGKRALPGGKGGLDGNPDPNEAINLEVASDFGVSFIKSQLVGVKYIDLKTPRLLFYYVGKLDGEPQIKSPKTTSEIKWFSLAELKNIELVYDKTDKEIINKLV